ncbi:hypothetical protein [Sphingobium sp. Ndbn-10]|uniref:hypothetical protein n=1 Tax=Sphingobium sp. Ndbn-10 TaxID=1667223 RepID=UPI001479EAF0|nr:hypothetical protein [Sphingobium sp. Ndbn-10]
MARPCRTGEARASLAGWTPALPFSDICAIFAGCVARGMDVRREAFALNDAPSVAGHSDMVRYEAGAGNCAQRNHIAALRICHWKSGAPFGGCLSGILS